MKPHGRDRVSAQPATSGIPWFDDRGKTVNAHCACLLEQHGRYYLFQVVAPTSAPSARPSCAS